MLAELFDELAQLLVTQFFLRLCLDIGLGLIILAIILGFIRLWRGPSLADRVVALHDTGQRYPEQRHHLLKRWGEQRRQRRVDC